MTAAATEGVWTTMDSPLGTLVLRACDDRLVGVAFDDEGRASGSATGRRDPEAALLRRAEAELDAYFHGELRWFEVPWRVEGTTFQKVVWESLLQIPYGQTWSYADLARRVGRPTATRAVGAANGRNPLAILLPCHRVIGGEGKLVGYGGGLERKRWLLALEAKQRGLF